MKQLARTEVRLDGTWCPGEVWDWEEHTDGWRPVVSARPQPGKTYIGRVPTSDVRVLGPEGTETHIDTVPTSDVRPDETDHSRGRAAGT